MCLCAKEPGGWNSTHLGSVIQEPWRSPSRATEDFFGCFLVGD